MATGVGVGSGVGRGVGGAGVGVGLGVGFGDGVTRGPPDGRGVPVGACVPPPGCDVRRGGPGVFVGREPVAVVPGTSPTGWLCSTWIRPCWMIATSPGCSSVPPIRA